MTLYAARLGDGPALTLTDSEGQANAWALQTDPPVYYTIAVDELTATPPEPVEEA